MTYDDYGPAARYHTCDGNEHDKDAAAYFELTLESQQRYRVVFHIAEFEQSASPDVSLVYLLLFDLSHLKVVLMMMGHRFYLNMLHQFKLVNIIISFIMNF